MAIGKGSRVEFLGPGRVPMYGLVYRMARGLAHVVADDGRTLRGSPLSMKESKKPIPADHPMRRFVKGDRIEFENASFAGWKPGTVTKIDQFGFMQVAADDGAFWKDIPAGKARPSDIPAPKNAAVSTHAKGARVEFDEGGTTLYGVVTKGGSRVEVTQDGGVHVRGGPAGLFRPSAQPVRTGAPDPMDRWSVGSYKLHASMSEETNCYEALVLLDGKKVIGASNRGTGGPDDFHALPGAPKGILERFEAEAKAWVGRHDDRADESNYRENGATWLDWWINKRPFGVTAKDFFDDWNRSFEEMSSKPFVPQ